MSYRTQGKRLNMTWIERLVVLMDPADVSVDDGSGTLALAVLLALTLATLAWIGKRLG